MRQVNLVNAILQTGERLDLNANWKVSFFPQFWKHDWFFFFLIMFMQTRLLPCVGCAQATMGHIQTCVRAELCEWGFNMEILVYIGIQTSQLIDIYKLVHYSDICIGFAFAWVAIKKVACFRHSSDLELKPCVILAWRRSSIKYSTIVC